MNTTTRRCAWTGLLAVLGAAVTAATWAGGAHGFAGVAYLASLTLLRRRG